MKTCGKCGVEKPRDCFHKSKAAFDGLTWRCKECASAYMRDYYRRNRETILDRANRWRRDNPEQSLDRYYRWAAANPERAQALKRKWAKANPETARLAQQRRRARLAALEVNDLTADQWEAIKTSAGGRCVYCGKKRNLTMDHVIPISRGGGHTASNIVACCKPCNSSKNAGPVIPYQLPLG